MNSPRPVSVVESGEFVPLCATTSVPVKLPAPVGLKRSVTVHAWFDVPGVSVNPEWHVPPVTEKTELPAPIATLVIVNELPVTPTAMQVDVAVFDCPLETSASPKFCGLGPHVSEAFGAADGGAVGGVGFPPPGPGAPPPPCDSLSSRTNAQPSSPVPLVWKSNLPS
jgi:hypothetical protein